MMSVELFVKMLRPRVEARTPFLAYWHPKGMMVLNTGVIEWKEYTVSVHNALTGARTYSGISENQLEAIRRQALRSREEVEVIKEKKRRKTVSASTVNKMRKIIARLQKDPRIHDVYIIEFDGTNLAGEGPDPDVLSSLNVEVKP